MLSAKSTFIFFVFALLTRYIPAQETKIKITVNNQTELTATLVSNSSVTALSGLLEDKPLVIEMHDYGNMEKVGPIGTSLPTNDEQITTEPGDIILYQGSALVIYYAPNSWNFTRLGKIDNVTQEELKNILGTGDVTVKLELIDTNTGICRDVKTENRYFAYPNPVSDYFTVPGTYESIRLINMKGMAVRKTTGNTLSVQGLDAGMYFLELKASSGMVHTGKVIVSIKH